MMEYSDKEIVRGILKNEKLWLHRFERQYFKRLLNFVLQRVDHFEDAEEIVQDAFTSAIYCLPTFRGDSKLYSWLCGIACHETADFYRKKKLKTILFSRIPMLQRIASRALSPEMALEEKEIKEKIARNLLKISEGYREVLRLKYIEGFSVGEIAEKLEKSAKSIEMKLRRARFAFVEVWNEEINRQQTLSSLDQRDLSFFKECFGVADSPLSDD